MFSQSNAQFDPFAPDAAQWDEVVDDKISNIDWSDPTSFFKVLRGPGGLPMPSSFPSPEEVRREAGKMSTRIFEDWESLRHILQRHEATIQKRWLKKTREQRRKILLAAWPNMPTTHRPDFEAFTKESERQREDGTKFKSAFMWPYINQEDLLKPRSLLLFLNARGRNLPGAFAMADFEASHFGRRTKAILPAFLNLYTMMFTSTRTPDTYGELLSWNEHPDASQWLFSRKGIDPGNGLDILKMQQRVLSFLVECCKHILHDISPDSLASEEFPIQPEPSSITESETGFNSLAVIAAEAPYRPPSHLDLTRLESLLSSKLSAAEDHVWALREDPSYFAECVGDFKEHRQEMMPDWNGQSHPVLKSGHERTFWNRVLGNLIGYAYLQVEVWKELHEQVVNLRALQEKLSREISIEKDLPDEYLTAVLKFQHYLSQASKRPIQLLKHGVVASPPLRMYFVREPQEPHSTMIYIRDKSGAAPDKIRKRLMWLFATLWDETQQYFVGLTTLVDELERLLQSDPKAKELTSFWVANVVSDLAIITECIHQIQIYQPWAKTFEVQLAERKQALFEDFAHRTRNWSQFLGFADGPMLSNLGNPSEKRFFYPVDKRRTRENVEAMRRAEENLDTFWHWVDQKMITRNENLDTTAVWRLLSKPQILQRTPEWVDRVEAPKTQPTDGDVQALCKPLSELYFELEHRTERTISHSETGEQKTKKKRRNIAQPAEESITAEAEPLERHLPDKQPTFAVSKRVLKVFSTLFYTPQTSQPGEIVWIDFLYAMDSVGFVPEKLYGSVWHFKPRKLDVERSIQFHEPHPTGKIPFRVARRHGRRLNRAYGWHSGMFVLVQKYDRKG